MKWTNEHTCAKGLMIKNESDVGHEHKPYSFLFVRIWSKTFCAPSFHVCIHSEDILLCNELLTWQQEQYIPLREKKLCNLFTNFAPKIHNAKPRHMYVFFESNDVDLIEVKKHDRNVWNGKFCARCEVIDSKRCIAKWR